MLLLINQVPEPASNVSPTHSVHAAEAEPLDGDNRNNLTNSDYAALSSSHAVSQSIFLSLTPTDFASSQVPSLSSSFPRLSTHHDVGSAAHRSFTCFSLPQSSFL